MSVDLLQQLHKGVDTYNLKIKSFLKKNKYLPCVYLNIRVTSCNNYSDALIGSSAVLSNTFLPKKHYGAVRQSHTGVR